MLPIIDLVVLGRTSGLLTPEVEHGIRSQREVQIKLHRVVGKARPNDECRYETIARARNEGKQCGNAPWVMFLDDDVVLGPRCISTLVNELSRRPVFAALAADYLGEHRAGEIAFHVAMGATLFRREALNQVRFRWAHDKCECRCCCNDLRRLHWGIAYCPSAIARHLPNGEASVAKCDPPRQSAAGGHVLAAFNRWHRVRFQRQFLHSLRASGNEEPVVAVAMGLYPSEQQRLRRLPGLTLVPRRDNGLFVGRQRLHAFQDILGTLPRDAPVAYWDVGDVIFQGRLKPIWELVQTYPDKVLAVREPASHPENPAVEVWTAGISDTTSRRNVQELLFRNPFLNAGFMAGTAATLLKYFRSVADWYDTPTLAGSSDPGDQIALNLYCHSRPEIWHELSESWNYCLARRSVRATYLDQHNRYVDVRGLPIHIVHGNARTLHSVPRHRKRFHGAPF